MEFDVPGDAYRDERRPQPFPAPPKVLRNFCGLTWTLVDPAMVRARSETVVLYHFHLHGAIEDRDERGTDLPSITAARIEATRHLTQIVNDSPDILWRGEEVRVEVTDATHLILFTIIMIGIEAPSLGHPHHI